MRNLAIILLALIFLTTACSKNEVNISLLHLPENYSLDDAKVDKCVIFENSNITYGQSNWNDFISTIDKSKPSTIRLAYYYTLDDPSKYSEEHYKEIKDDYPKLYIKDLISDGKKYIIQGVEEGNLVTKEYKYLMKYKGQPNSKFAVFSYYTYYVLVNDSLVTWDDIEHGMFSSKFGDWIDHYKVYSKLVYK